MSETEATPPKNLPTALVVDDEPYLLKAIARILRNDFVTVAYEAPESALVYLGTEAPCDVVLTDVHFPGMSVGAFIDQLKALRPSLATKVVYISGSDFELADRIAEEGNKVLQKPFAAKDLIEALKARVA